MKKPLLSALLVFCMMMTMMPAVAFATDGDTSGEPTESTVGANSGNSPEVPNEPEVSEQKVFVSKNGNDETGDGSEEKPYATLTKAVAADSTKSGATIYVMSDLVMKKCARYFNKHLTITSAPGQTYTISRDTDFATLSDSARSLYNPAMIEVGGTKFNQESSLTLENIVLDDAGKHQGEYFIQAEADGDGNTAFGNGNISNGNIVQDAMIATYNNTATITLGDGAVLQNYGGMSAVRVSGGVLTMESGSKIIDDNITDRTKGTAIDGADKSLYGPAGAIWVQGGLIHIESGAYIGGNSSEKPMIGRGIYIDGGTVNVDGMIQYVKGDTDCWMGEDGIAVHIRNSGTATIGGTVSDLTASSTSTGRGVYATGGKLILDGTVKNCKMMNAVYISGAKEALAAELNGTISDNTLDGNNGYAVVIENTDATFSSTSVIENNNSDIATVYAPAGANIELYGKIRNNTGGQCGGIFLYGNYTAYRDITVDMYNGAEITGNKNTDFFRNRGGAICSGGSTHGPKSIFTMHGGLISDNTASSGAVLVRKNGQAVMTGGTISENSGYGVRVDGSDSGMPDPSFKMSGGQIINNGSSGISATMTYGTVLDVTDDAVVAGNGGTSQITISNGDATDTSERAMIDAGVLSGERTVTAAGYNLRLEEGYADIGLGQANSAVKTTVTDYLTSNDEYNGWTAIGNALWLKPSADAVNFQMGRTSSVKNLGLYIAYIPLNSDGMPVAGTDPVIQKVDNEEWINIALQNLQAGTSYGLVLVHNKEYTLAPDDITIYTGGGHGDENYDNGGVLQLSIAGSVDLSYNSTIRGYDLKSLEVNGEEWTGAVDNTLLDQLTALFNVTYTDEDGTTITDDSQAGEYTATLSLKDGYETADIKINGNETNLDGEGSLIVRHTEEITKAQNGEITHELMSEEPSESVQNATAIAKGQYSWSDPEFYTNDDENRQVDAAGIRILDDSLLKYEGEDRQRPMEEKAEEYLGAPDTGRAYRYQFHYLDLVDAHNGNAWVSASGGATVYLPYPDGVTADSAENLKVQVIHYKDLHREYGITGQDDVEEAIEACELETMPVEFTDAGIKFDTERAGFSPFAVVWQTPAHTITATAGDGGTITPSGTVTVADGADKTFTIRANDGYHIADVKADGQSVNLPDNGTYTFERVTKDHTIEATFARDSSGGGNTTSYTITASAGNGGVIDPSGSVRVSRGSDKTFTITANEGYEIADVLVDGESVGAVSEYTFENVREKHMIEARFTASGEIPVADPDDTGVSNWLNTEDHIVYLNGYEDNSFRPDANMTRAEVAQMFYNLLTNKDVAVTVSFTDVASDAWYAEAVNTLASLGMITGVGDNRYEPDRSITRAEFTAIAMRFADLETGGDNIFSDVAENAWYYDYVVGSIQYGWITGYPDGTFRPENTITRAEVTTIVNRMLGRSADRTFIVEHADELRSFNDVTTSHWSYYAVMEATNAHNFTKDNGVETWNELSN